MRQCLSRFRRKYMLLQLIGTGNSTSKLPYDDTIQAMIDVIHLGGLSFVLQPGGGGKSVDGSHVAACGVDDSLQSPS